MVVGKIRSKTTIKSITFKTTAKFENRGGNMLLETKTTSTNFEKTIIFETKTVLKVTSVIITIETRTPNEIIILSITFKIGLVLRFILLARLSVNPGKRLN
jgi:hypothetical protein